MRSGSCDGGGSGRRTPGRGEPRVNRRLLLVITTLDRGGAETQVAAIALGLRARGWDVTVASLLPPGAIGEQLRAAGLPVHSLDMVRGRPDPRSIVQLGRIIRRLRPEIVHGHMVHANLLCRTTRVFVGFPLLVCTVHSIDEEGRGREIGYRLTDWLCDVTTTVSQASRDRYLRLGLVAPSRLEFIPNGIELERFTPHPARRDRARAALGLAPADWAWVAVGRLDPPKDPVTLVRAFARTAGDDPTTRLLLVGGGRLEGATRNLVAELGLPERVRMLGPRDDIPDLLAAADGFVLSSHWEGLPVSILEAGAARLPVVATAVPGTTELVQDGITGVLAEAGNAEALARALARVRAMPVVERTRLGAAAAQQAMDGYGMSHVLDCWESLYARRGARGGPASLTRVEQA